MSQQPLRLPGGGLIDRSRPVEFSFNGKKLQGYAGDTLASALIANDVRLVGRSFKYHRRRGIFGAGVEEPNALIALRDGNREEPNLRATGIELFDGLTAASQNRWPSLDFDVGGINGILSRFLPAGFYYKTFMWPGNAWMFYERIIRAAAGLGKAPLLADPDVYERRHVHCDVLIVGAGPSGLSAAQAAAKAREWPKRRTLRKVAQNARPTGVSSTSARTAPTMRKRRSIRSSRKAYRMMAVVPPRCQKSTTEGQGTRIARQYMQRGGSCFFAWEASAADSLR